MLSRLAPGPVVRWFARPYVAGDSLQAALAVAVHNLAEEGTRTTLDLLGEGVTRQAQIEANEATYRRMIDRVATDPRFPDPASRPSISLKPSAFTIRDRDQAAACIARLAEHAHAAGIALTVDMEDHSWTDFTLDLAVRLFRRGFDLGTVLQTRLNRTEGDLERIPEGMRLRLVIGIYKEASDIAVTDKRVMKERMLAYARALLARGVFLEFGTHDVACVERFAREVAPLAPERCEVQMLLGVPRRGLRRRLREGTFGPRLPIRLYVPFALGWQDATAYLRRRMAESPGTTWLVVRNLFSRNGDR